MTTQQPEALRLAEHLEQFRSFPDDLAAAAELRRLHAESEQHLQELRSYRITVENREARIAELESQLAAAQQGVQNGWKLVPVEATPDMLEQVWYMGYDEMRDVYRVLVAAAPRSPSSNPTTQWLDAQIIQALSAGMSIEQWQSSVDVRIGPSDLLGRAIASGEETRIELVRRAVSEVFAAQAKREHP